jgi:CheY-like chemotaxis protein
VNVVQVIHAGRDLLLVLLAGTLVWFIRKPLSSALAKPGSQVSAFGVTVKVGENEIPVQEASDQLGKLVGDLQVQVSSLLQGQAGVSAAKGTKDVPAVAATDVRRDKHVVLAVNPKRLLWVDDVPTNNAYVAEQLRSKGVQIVQAPSTAEGIRAFHDQGPFGAVITDMARTEGGQYNPAAGVDLAKQLRASDPDLPVVVFATQRGIRAQAQGLAEAGVALATSSPVELLTALQIAD